MEDLPSVKLIIKNKKKRETVKVDVVSLRDNTIKLKLINPIQTISINESTTAEMDVNDPFFLIKELMKEFFDLEIDDDYNKKFSDENKEDYIKQFHPELAALNCDEIDPNVNNCMLPGDYLTCASVDGLTNDPIGVYPIELVVNVYTSGTLTLFGGTVTVPVVTNLYDAVGSYESITGYNIVISNTTSYEMFNSNEFALLQNVPNPTINNTTIQFNTPNSNMIRFKITDMFGKVVYSENIKSDIGLNTIEFNNKLSTGVYTYSVQNEEEIISKRMIISE